MRGRNVYSTCLEIDALQVYVKRDGETDGPFAPQEVVDMIRREQLVGDHEIWIEGTANTVTVEELLGSHRKPSEVDSSILDHLMPKPFVSRAKTDARWRNVEELCELIPLSLGFLPGCGLMSIVLAALGGLSGLLLFLGFAAVFIWGTIDMNWQGARESHLRDLRVKIVHYVEQHPDAGQFSLEQLQQAGVVDQQDLDLMDDLDVVYHPIAADSPTDTVIFTRGTGDSEKRYEKGNVDAFYPPP